MIDENKTEEAFKEIMEAGMADKPEAFKKIVRNGWGNDMFYFKYGAKWAIEMMKNLGVGECTHCADITQLHKLESRPGEHLCEMCYISLKRIRDE